MKIDETSDTYAGREYVNRHLLEEHGLFKTVAYVHLRKPEKQRSSGAARTAKCREKKKENGLVQVYLPAEAAEAIKAAGSFEAWQEKANPKISEERREELHRWIRLGQKFESLPGWVRWLIDLL